MRPSLIAIEQRLSHPPTLVGRSAYPAFATVRSGSPPNRSKRYFEDFAIGDRTQSNVGRTISEADVYTEAGLVGSYAELHMNREFASTTQYGRRVVQNTLLLSITAGLVKRTDWEPETVTIYGQDGYGFSNPCSSTRR